MATHDYVIANQSGAAFRTDLNNALAAIVSNNSNSSEPATKYAYQWWADTSAAVMKIRNSANDGWVELFQLDGTLTLEDGSASAPALSFRDDLDTGVFSSSANTFCVATAGVIRMELGTASTIFNDGGGDVDFRIEGDTEPNLFKVDAGLNRVGVGVSSPSATFDVAGDIEATIANNAGYLEGLNITNGVNADFNVNVKTNSTSIGPSTNTPFCFHVGGHANEKARITNNGNFLIGTTSGTERFKVESTANTVVPMTINDSSNTATLTHRLLFATGGTEVGRIRCTNSETQYNTSASDRTLKKNFESWNEDVLSLFKNINPQKFNFIQEEDGANKTKGFIAQEITDNFPEAYSKGEKEDDKYWFNPSGMVVYLMKAIQELEAKIATLEAAQ